MSVKYSAGVFYGACVPRASELGRKLDRLIDNHGGTPAPTDVKCVEISVVGSDSEEWLTVQIEGSANSFGSHQEFRPPRLLLEQTMWPHWIGAFLAREGATVDDMPPVGWHFAGWIS